MQKTEEKRIARTKEEEKRELAVDVHTCKGDIGRPMWEEDNERHLERKAERYVDAEDQIERQSGSGVARRGAAWRGAASGRAG